MIGMMTMVGLMLHMGPPADALTADAVRASVRRATGWDKLALQTGGIRASGTCALFGNDVPAALNFDAHGRFVREFDGPVRYGLAFNGREAWGYEFGGQPRLAELSERAETLLVGAAMTNSWLASDSGLEFSVDSAGTDAEKVTLSYRNVAGHERGEIEIDRATWRPRRFTVNGAGAGGRTLTFDGSREFAGVVLPATISEKTGAGLEMVLHIEKLAPAPAFVRSPYDMPPAPRDDVHFDPAAAPQLSIERAATGHLLVKPRVNGRDVGWFIVDTGAGATCLSAKTAAALHLEKLGAVQALGVGGPVESPLHRLQSLEVGPVRLDRGVVIALDFDFLTAPLGREIAGVLGFDLLSRCIVEMDLAAGQVALHDPAKFRDNGITWSKLYLPGRIPALEGKIEGHDAILRLDSGNSGAGLVIHYPAVERLKLLEGRPTTSMPGGAGGVGGAVPTARGTLSSVEFGGQRIADLETTFIIAPRGAFADEYASGVMGAPLLKRYTVLIDYPGRKIAFRPHETQ